MKRSGVVLVIVGLAVGLLPTIFYTINNFAGSYYLEDWYEAVAKTAAVVNLVSSVLVLIGFIVIASGLSKQAPTYPAPQAYPPPGGYAPALGDSPRQSTPDLHK